MKKNLKNKNDDKNNCKIQIQINNKLFQNYEEETIEIKDRRRKCIFEMKNII